jgi:hypothetical protein
MSGMLARFRIRIIVCLCTVLLSPEIYALVLSPTQCRIQLTLNKCPLLLREKLIPRLSRNAIVCFGTVTSGDDVDSPTAQTAGSSDAQLIRFQTLQQALARVPDFIPKPLLYGAVAVVSGLLFFELSKLVLAMSVPVLLVLASIQSIREKMDEIAAGPKVIDTDAEFVSSPRVSGEGASSGADAEDEAEMRGFRNKVAEMKESAARRAQTVGRLSDIQKRISEASGDLKAAINSASSLRDKISNHQRNLDGDK